VRVKKFGNVGFVYRAVPDAVGVNDHGTALLARRQAGRPRNLDAARPAPPGNSA
jgi:hypothetical protein